MNCRESSKDAARSRASHIGARSERHWRTCPTWIQIRTSAAEARSVRDSCCRNGTGTGRLIPIRGLAVSVLMRRESGQALEGAGRANQLSHMPRKANPLFPQMGLLHRSRAFQPQSYICEAGRRVPSWLPATQAVWGARPHQCAASSEIHCVSQRVGLLPSDEPALVA
ncbi:hypothetical protein D9M70_553190 [compost metagenome]